MGDFCFAARNGLPLLTIPLFERTSLVTHGFSTRQGGVSSDPFSTLNLGLSKNDEKAKVLENRRRFCNALNINLESLVAGQQVHGAKIAVITDKDKGRGAHDYSDGLPDTDALITAASGVALSVYCADCVPLLILDPVRKVIGAAHAGWRGTVAKIGAKTIIRMGEVFGSKASDCLIGIGPSIGPCCYEVDEIVINSLALSFPYWQELVTPCGSGKWYLDLWATNKRQLQDIGVKRENVLVSRYCTACQGKLFFSYRAQNKITGSLAATIALK